MFSQNTHSKIRNRGDIVEHYLVITFGAGLANPSAVEQGGAAIWTVTQETVGVFRLKAAADLSKRPGYHVNHQCVWVAADKLGTAPLTAVPIVATAGSTFAWSQTTGELFFKTLTPAGVLTSPAAGTQVYMEIVQRQNKINATNL